MKKIIVALSIVSSMGAFANQGGAYGESGCGLGSMLITDHGVWWKQVFSGTTNSLFGTQTFGISSGTSNCDHSPMNEGAKTSFIEANRSNLVTEIAQGAGNTLNALVKLYGKNDTTHVLQLLQKNFAVIFPTYSVSAGEINTHIESILTQAI